jgi:hypothetical protein
MSLTLSPQAAARNGAFGLVRDRARPLTQTLSSKPVHNGWCGAGVRTYAGPCHPRLPLAGSRDGRQP